MNAGAIHRSRRNTILVALVLVLSSTALTLDLDSRSASAANPTVTISQTDGLANGQSVRIELSGFDPGPVYVHQCAHGAVSWAQCAEVSRVEGVADANGNGTIDYPVWGGVLPRPDVVGFGNQPLECVGNSCAIVVSECPFDVVSTRTSATRIALQQGGTQPPVPTSSSTTTTSTTTPTPGNITGPTIAGLGSTQSQLAMSRWQTAAFADPHGLDVDYTPVNAPSGLASFVNDEIDFALTTLPLDTDQIAELQAANRGYAYVPVGLSALGVAYRLKINGVPLHELQLSPESIARLYRGEISFWNNPALSTDNEGCRLPGGGRYPVPSFRTDQSGANLTFSSWLDGAAKDIWQLGADSIIPIDDSQVFGEIGTDRLALFIDRGLPDQAGPLPDRANNASAGRIGFIDRTYARERGLPLASIRNAGGVYVQPTQESIEAALAAADPNADGVLIPDFEDPDPAIYPMFTVTYALVPTTLSSSFTQAEADVLRAFLEFVLTPEGQALATETGFFELTDQLVDQAQTNLDLIPSATAPPPPTGPGPLPEGVDPAVIDDLASFVADTAFDAGSSGVGSSGRGSSGSSAAGVDDLGVDDGSGDDEGDDEDGIRGVLARALGAASGVATLPLLFALGLLALAVGPAVRYYARRRQEL